MIRDVDRFVRVRLTGRYGVDKMHAVSNHEFEQKSEGI